MRQAGKIRLLLAFVCSWQTAYQICDRYGDAFKAISAQVSASKTVTVVADNREVDYDAALPLTLGRTLLPGHADFLPELTVIQFAGPPLDYSSADRVVGMHGRAPPGLRDVLFDPPPSRQPFLARAAVYSLAPPAV